MSRDKPEAISSGAVNIREILFLKRVLDKSRDLRHHGNQQLHCLQTIGTDSRMRKPQCKVLGTSSCEKCLSEETRAQMEEDTRRVVRDVVEHKNRRGSERTPKERALLNCCIRYAHLLFKLYHNYKARNSK